MAAPKISATTTVTTEVTVSSRIRQMLKARLEEHTRLAREIKDRKARQERIQGEVAELFAKEGQDAALEAGADIDGVRVKRVRGKTRKLNESAVLRAFEITKAEWDAFYDERERKSYIRITAPGEKDSEE